MVIWKMCVNNFVNFYFAGVVGVFVEFGATKTRILEFRRGDLAFGKNLWKIQKFEFRTSPNTHTHTH